MDNLPKDFKLALRTDKAIRERMARERKNTQEMRRTHDQVRRHIDETAKKLGL